MPIDPIVDDDFSPGALAQWLRNQYSRHKEIEDLKAAEFIEAAEQRVVEAEKERDEANAQSRAWALINHWNIREDGNDLIVCKGLHDRNVDCSQKERRYIPAEAAEQQIAQLRSALAELVRLKDLKGMDTVEEYKRCKPLAWIAARKALEP